MSDPATPGLKPDPRVWHDLLRRLGGPVHLNAILPDPKPGEAAIRSCWHVPGDAATAAAWAAKLNSEGFNLHFQVGVVRPGFGGFKASAADIVRVRAAHCDVDPAAHETAADMKERARLVAAMKHAPSVVLLSGNGFQCLWLLADEAELGEDDAVLFNQRLAHALGGDAGARDVCRLLRLPGTVNWPNAAKRKAGRVPVLAHTMRSDARRYGIAELADVIAEAEALGLAQGWRKTADVVKLRPIDDSDGPDTAASRALAAAWVKANAIPAAAPELRARLEAALAAKDGGAFSRRWCGDELAHAATGEIDRSASDFGLVHAALEAGLARDADEAAAVLLHWAEVVATEAGWSAADDTQKYPRLSDQARYVARIVAKSMAHLKMKGTGPDERAAAVEALPIETGPPPPAEGEADADAVVDEVNNEGFCSIVDRPGTHRLDREMEAPSRWTLRELQSRYKPFPVLLPRGRRGALVEFNKADVWHDSPRRRTYAGVVQRFYGAGEDDPMLTELHPESGLPWFNLFPGYPAEMKALARLGLPTLRVDQLADAAIVFFNARPGDALDRAWRHAHFFLFHIICKGDLERLAWWVNFLAQMVQRPQDVVDTYPVLADSGGTGKSLFVTHFIRSLLSPRNFIAVADKDRLFGRFNAHLIGKVFCALTEATWAGDPRDKARIRGLVGEERKPIEVKGGGVFDVDWVLRIAILTNDELSTPIAPFDRRATVMAPSAMWVGQEAMYGQLVAEAPVWRVVWQAVMVTAAIHRPKQFFTDELGAQIMKQMSGISYWLLRALEDPERDGIVVHPASAARGWPTGEVSYQTLFTSFVGSLSRYGGREAEWPQQVFSAELAKLLDLKSWVVSPAGQRSERRVMLPPLGEARRRFAAKLKERIEWSVPAAPETPPAAW